MKRRTDIIFTEQQISDLTSRNITVYTLTKHFKCDTKVIRCHLRKLNNPLVNDLLDNPVERVKTDISMPNPMTDDDREAVSSGKSTVSKIASKYGVCWHTANKWCRDIVTIKPVVKHNAFQLMDKLKTMHVKIKKAP